MTQHLDDGTLQALLDGEIRMEEEQGGREHLAACIDCRGRMAGLREANSTLSAALRLLDPHPRPLRAAPAPALSPPSSSRVGSRRWGGVGLARAAAMLLTVTAAASATIPGSPVRDWLLNRGGDPSAEVVVVTTAEAPGTESVAATAAMDDAAGVTVDAENGELRIEINDAGPDVRIIARLVPVARGGVIASAEAANGRFEASPGVIQVTGVTGGELRVEIPRATSRATVLIDGRVHLEKDGNAIRMEDREWQIDADRPNLYLLRPGAE